MKNTIRRLTFEYIQESNKKSISINTSSQGRFTNLERLGILKVIEQTVIKNMGLKAVDELPQNTSVSEAKVNTSEANQTKEGKE